jgi:cellulose synthase/poly-beta-1,6-N-acetylglucosamine synthase-like glycosyltransferase
MSGLMSSAWLAMHALLAVPVLWIWLQTLFARDPRCQGGETQTLIRPADSQTLILIPAHNESVGLVPTLESLRQQLVEGDQILVVADNCRDDTADIARSAGVCVVERGDTSRRGKGWALDFGVRHIEANRSKFNPKYVMIFDADCLLTPGSLNRLIARCVRTQLPVQGLYLMSAEANAGLQKRIAEFAWRMKNKVRPLGGSHLGSPCQLAGTGMIFPWSVLVDTPLASGNIVEDMQMGVDLALKGYPPQFEPLAVLTSKFPESSEGAQSQRARWEHGHIATLLHAGPQLIGAGLRRMSPPLVLMGIDLMVPPLALLSMSIGGVVLLDLVIWWLSGWSVAWWFGLFLLFLLTMAVAITWKRHGEGTITGRELLMAPLYALRKIPLYVAFVFKRQTHWVRAKRDGE